jgi:hypothetical protein
VHRYWIPVPEMSERTEKCASWVPVPDAGVEHAAEPDYQPDDAGRVHGGGHCHILQTHLLTFK